MNILLIGEYSRLHNSLKEGLEALGHQVTLVGNGDLFKNYPADIHIAPVFFNKPIVKRIRNAIHLISNKDIADYEVAFRFKKALPKLKNYDIVQLINENALCIRPSLEIKLLNKLFAQNKAIYLLCCGDDYISINHYLKEEQPYSILTPYLENPKLKNYFEYALKYTRPAYKKLHDFIYKYIQGVVATDLDYHITQQGRPAYLGMIPNPVNVDKLKFTPLKIDDKVKIFHGINTLSSIKKGNDYFSKALDIIAQEHPDKVEIMTSYSLPYNEYIKQYNEAHIVLDQVYAFDQGYNALEAMAKGKVVFTGAEKIWLEHYNLKEDDVAINALPNVEYLVKKLEWLILNPDKLVEISKNARAFIQQEHHYKAIAKRYLDVWSVT